MRLAPIYFCHTAISVAFVISVIGFCVDPSKSSAADHCNRSPGTLILSRPGQHQTPPILFDYEFRSEKYDITANRYLWCIQSDRSNQNVVFLNGAMTTMSSRYLRALIEPGKGLSMLCWMLLKAKVTHVAFPSPERTNLSGTRLTRRRSVHQQSEISPRDRLCSCAGRRNYPD